MSIFKRKVNGYEVYGKSDEALARPSTKAKFGAFASKVGSSTGGFLKKALAPPTPEQKARAKKNMESLRAKSKVTAQSFSKGIGTLRSGILDLQKGFQPPAQSSGNTSLQSQLKELRTKRRISEERTKLQRALEREKARSQPQKSNNPFGKMDNSDIIGFGFKKR